MQRVFPTPDDSLIVICISVRKVTAAGGHLSTKGLNVKLKINK